MSRFFLLFLVLIIGCIDETDSNHTNRGAVYVSPTIDKYGHFKKGYVRMPVSTDRNAIHNRNKSRYYFQTRGKYLHRPR